MRVLLNRLPTPVVPGAECWGRRAFNGGGGGSIEPPQNWGGGGAGVGKRGSIDRGPIH